MATTEASAPAAAAAHSPREHYLRWAEMEHATTLRVLRAYPADQADLRPHEKCKTARELAWTFVAEQSLAERALTTDFDWSQPPGFPQPPATLGEVITALEQAQARVMELVRQADNGVSGTVSFFVAPKTLGDIPKIEFLRMLLCDEIHHRGQFSIYLRMADGKVPSIYGPTADEPWM